MTINVLEIQKDLFDSNFLTEKEGYIYHLIKTQSNK